MSSKHYFNYLGTVWDLIPEEDKNRLGELWLGFEQVFGSVYQRFAEVSLNTEINSMLPYTTNRWLPYIFDETNHNLTPAVYTSSQDLSVGVNLTIRFLIKFSIDGGAPIELDLRGYVPETTTIFEIIDKLNNAAGFAFARAILDNSILQFVSSSAGPNSTITWFVPSDPSRDASEFVLGLLQSDLPLTVPEFPWQYILPTEYKPIVSIPELRTHVRDDNLDADGFQLLEGTDYVVNREAFYISFKVEPPTNMWAKRTLVDEETPWHNFGFLMDIYDINNAQYTSILQGLWFAFWSGPKPHNLRKALYLLFSLPVALEDTTVSKVTSTIIETTSSDGIIREFVVPSGLTPVVIVGEKLLRFDPLVDGIFVYDKVNLPGFIETEIGRPNIQRFLTENATRGYGDTDETKALKLLEEHTFLPQISVDSFTNPKINLGNVKIFLEGIKPLHKTFLFQVIVGSFRDEIEISDKLSMHYDIEVTPNLDSNQTTFADPAETLLYETVTNEAMDLDSDGILFQEAVHIDVYSFGLPIDSFDA